MKCIVIEDETPAIKLLVDYISKIPKMELIATCDTAIKALDVLNSQKIDLMFLDIHMPGLTGIEMLKTLNTKPMVIITSAYSEYAIEGYELDVVDYLLKPVSFERFLKSVNKAIGRNVSKGRHNVDHGSLNEENVKDHMFVKSDYKLVKVVYNEILFIEGMSEYVRIHTHNKKIVTLKSLKNLVDELPADQFIRIHKSFIVSIPKITAIVGNSLEIDGKLITVGKSYRSKVMAFLK